MIFWIVFVLIFLPLHIFYPTKILNRQKLPKKGNKCIVASNHFSNLDVFLFSVGFKRKFEYLAKKEIFKSKIAAFFVKALGGIPVDRGKITPSTYKTVVGELAKNKQIFIFPEGHRNQSGTDEMQEAHAGVVVFASKTDSEIVPMILYKKPKIFRKNYIIVGEPFKVIGEDPKRLTKEEIDENIKIYNKVADDLRNQIKEYIESKKKKKK